MKYSKEAKELGRVCVETYSDNSEAMSYNIMVTQRCPFECAHCLNDSSPRSPAGVFGPKDVDSVLRFHETVNDFFKQRQSADFNFIGGEPTLYTSALEFLLRSFQPYGSLQMTTNGWWLRSAVSFVRVMSAIMDYVDDHDMSVRISHSPYHAKFRTREELQTVEGLLRWRTAVRSDGDIFAEESPLGWMIEGVMDNLMANSGETVVCRECDHEYRLQEQRSECPACGERNDHEDRYYEVMDMLGLKMCNRGGLRHYIQRFLESMLHTTYVDHQRPSGVVATGRAGRDSVSFEGGQCYTSQKIFTVDPGGAVRDVCCAGVPIGTEPMGHVDDGVLLAVRRVQLMLLIEKRFPNRCRWDERGRDAKYKACTSCNKSTYAVLHGRTLQEEARQAIKYIKQYGRHHTV